MVKSEFQTKTDEYLSFLDGYHLKIRMQDDDLSNKIESLRDEIQSRIHDIDEFIEEKIKFLQGHITPGNIVFPKTDTSRADNDPVYKMVAKQMEPLRKSIMREDDDPHTDIGNYRG